MSDTPRDRTPVGVVALGAALALAAIFFAWRAATVRPVHASPASETGVFEHAGAERARALMVRLATGLMAAQEEDGSFRTEVEAVGTGYNDPQERIVASSLATLALATVRARGLVGTKVTTREGGSDAQAPVVELAPAVFDAALGRALAYVRSRRLPDGTFARINTQDPWAAVQATTAAAWALLLVDDPADAPLIEGALVPLAKIASGGVDVGYGRCLLGMFAARLRESAYAAGLEGGAESLVDVRLFTTLPSKEGWLLWESTISEVIARIVKSARTGAFDPLPAQALAAVLDLEPTWRGDATAPKDWWTRGWMAARSGHSDSKAWFERLVEVLEERVEPAGLLPGGYYGNPLEHAAVSILALDAGLAGMGV